MIRPELRQALMRRREQIAAALTLVAGLWLGTRGGWLLAAFGGAVALLGAGWSLAAHRRQRFAGPVADPGLVEVLEGRIGYFGAGQLMGGTVALQDLAEIRLLTLRSAQYWRLKTLDGQAILIPTRAAGAEALFDAFATLPGADMGRISAALAPGGPPDGAPAQSLWTRPGAALP